ncbi:MAG: hypothetical protein PVG83_01135 [Acidimicrobiia bacterium]
MSSDGPIDTCPECGTRLRLLHTDRAGRTYRCRSGHTVFDDDYRPSLIGRSATWIPVILFGAMFAFIAYQILFS